MDMKHAIEIDEEITELTRTPSHIDLPLIKAYPIVSHPSRIMNDIRFVNFMKRYGDYLFNDYINVIQLILSIEVVVHESQTAEMNIITMCQDAIDEYLENSLGIADEKERRLVMYRLLNKARDTRVSYLAEYNTIWKAYVKLFDQEPKPPKLRYGEPIKTIRGFKERMHNGLYETNVSS